MGRGDAYGLYYRTGRQDCGNTFDLTDVKIDSGDTAEEIVDRSLEWMSLEDWIAQNEDVSLTSLSFEEAYLAWKAGWRDCAIVHVQQALRFHLTKAETLFARALRTPGAQSVDVAQDIALANNIKLGAFSEKVAEINGYHTIAHAGSIGEFELDDAGLTWVRWETEPDRRNYAGTGTLTMQYSFRGQEWNTSMGLSRAARHIESIASRGDIDVNAARDWRRRALEYAWLAVKVFKDEDEGLGDKKLTHELMATIKERCADFDYIEPITADELFENPARARRRNGKPEHDVRDEENAVDKYREFNSFDPKKLVYVDGSPIPAKLRCLGEATQIVYESMKVIPDNGVKPRKPQGYFHDHEGDVFTYVPDAAGDTDTPSFVLECDALALIGTCIEFSYKGEDGEKGKGKATKPYPEVYCTPNGRALLVIQSKKTVLAIIYGGGLGVESRGIVG